MRAVSLACCLSLLAASAATQGIAPPGKPDPVEVRNLSASYELTNADSTLRCPIALEPKPAEARNGALKVASSSSASAT